MESVNDDRSYKAILLKVQKPIDALIKTPSYPFFKIFEFYLMIRDENPSQQSALCIYPYCTIKRALENICETSRVIACFKDEISTHT